MMRNVTNVLLVLLVGALAGGAAFVFSESQTPEYQATASLGYGRLLSPELQVLGNSAGDPDVDDEVRLATEARRVRSYDVAVRTAKAAPSLGLSPVAVFGQVSATPADGSLVVVLTARASSAAAANLLCQTYADQFLKLVKEREQRRAGAVARALRIRLDGLAPSDRNSLPGATLRNQIAALGVLQRVGSGSPQLIEGARASSAPASPQTTRNVLFGLLFGLAAGIGLVALRAEGRRRAALAGQGAPPPRPREEPHEW